MTLEDKIKEKVDSWDIQPTEIVRPILYGISKDIAEKVTRKAKRRMNKYGDQSFLNLGPVAAAEEFKKVYLRHNLHETYFNRKQTAWNTGMADTALSRLVKDTYGCTVMEARAEPKLLETNVNSLEEIQTKLNKELVSYAQRELSKYNPAFSFTVGQTISENSKKIADSLVSLCLTELTSPELKDELFELEYQQAVKEFRKRYITKQLERTNGNYEESAKLMGITVNYTKQLAHRSGISLNDIRNNKTRGLK
jgi:DNA-binding NtrC family response regulator